jgi:hypothetical protein
MTGTIEQPKHTGASAAWPEASTSLVQADDILTPEELAAYSVFSALTKRFAQPGLKVLDSWVYEKTRGRCRNPIPCLRLGRYVRYWVAVATWLTAPAPSDTSAARPASPDRRKAIARRPSRPT